MNSWSIAGFLEQVTAPVTNWYDSMGLAGKAGPQGFLIFVTLFLAWLFYRFLICPWIDPKIRERDAAFSTGQIWQLLIKRLSLPVLWLLLLWIPDGVSRHYGLSRGWLYVAEVLLLAWIISRALLTLISLLHLKRLSRTLGSLITLLIWLVAVLELAQLLAPTLAVLDKIDLRIGPLRLTLLHIIAAILLLTVFLWLSRAVISSFSAWISSRPNITPSFQVLSQKLFVVGFYALAIVLILGGLVLDLTNFAWFSGAIGLGLGFGLQKVISNLASGFIILADKSIKPGDVIQVGQTYGWINHLGSRYISVVTRDGIEHLIPNEDLITGQVINWSYSNNLVRLKVPVGLAYGSDLELAMKVMLEAAKATPRVLPLPEPSCRLLNLGDSSLNFQLYIWISDPQNGIQGVMSDVSLEILKRFREHGIEIPFPQRVLYHKEMPEIRLWGSRKEPQSDGS